jgi:hypothetical protein
MEKILENKRFLFFGVAAILIFGLLLFFIFSNQSEESVPEEVTTQNPSEAVQETEPEISNFEECENAGGELFGDFLEQCRWNSDRVFTRELTEEEKKENEVVKIKNQQKSYQIDYFPDFKIFYPTEWNLDTSSEFNDEKLVNFITLNKNDLQIKYVIDIYQLPRGLTPECVVKNDILEKEEVVIQEIDRVSNEFVRYRFRDEPGKYYYLAPSAETNVINPCSTGEESVDMFGYSLDLKENYPFGAGQLVSKGFLTVILEGNPNQEELQEVNEIIFLTEGISQG